MVCRLSFIELIKDLFNKWHGGHSPRVEWTEGLTDSESHSQREAWRPLEHRYAQSRGSRGVAARRESALLCSLQIFHFHPGNRRNNNPAKASFSYATDIPETTWAWDTPGHTWTYLGLEHRYGICEYLSPNQNLSQALTAGLPVKLSWVQLRRQAGGCQRWKYFMWTSSADATYSRKTIRSIFTGGMVENCANSICISRKFEYICDPSQVHRGPTGTDRRTLSVATGDYVAGRSAGYEDQA